MWDRASGAWPPGREVWVGLASFLDVLDAAAERGDVTITFDDGNASDVEIALPALQGAT